MALFTEFVKADLSEDQTLPILRELLPVLLTILGDDEVRPFNVFPSRPSSLSGQAGCVVLILIELSLAAPYSVDARPND
jgi:hypothetical protein